MTVPGGRQEGTDRFSVEPGKSQAVRVNIATRYIRTREPYEKNDIIIDTNDPDNPLIRLTMKLQVVDILIMKPDMLNFGAVRTGTVNTREVMITNKSKERITLTKITAYPDSVLKTSPQGDIALEPGKSITVLVTFQPVGPPKRFFGTFQIETSIDVLKMKSISVRATVE